MTETVPRARPFLSTKLNPPAPAASEVRRVGICDLVRASQSVRMVLVRAPAGFGKTTAMVQCRSMLQAHGVDTAWLTLDSADNDASRFLACLSAAVGMMTGDLPTVTEDDPAQANPSPGDMALEIMERLASHGAPFVLFLDDFEAVQEPTVMRLVREILDHLPRGGQVIIGSRGLPDLGLGRLRARGQLLEIEASQLRFSIAETTEFLTHRRHIVLPEEELSLLHRKTEGWIAALWLASVSLERREGRSEFISRFSGSNQAIADYLAEDVLAHQGAEVRDFLLRTSILRHLDESLCDALLPGSRSGDILRRLEASNLFLIPIEGEEKAYRYHSLFAGFLCAQLKREMPQEVLGLHRAAARWYMARGRPVPAIDHALEGENYGQAVDLLSLHGESLLEGGRMRLLARWFAMLPERTIHALPLLQTIHVWSVCLTRGPWEAMALLEQSGVAASQDPQVLAHVLALRPLMLAMMDRNEEAFALGREALARLPPGQAFADSVLSNEMAYVFAVMGEYQEAHKLLDASRRQGGPGSFFNRMYSESVEGIIDLEEGRLRQATARFRIAVGSTHAASYRHTGGNAWAGVLYAASLYESNDLDQAEHLLHVYVPLARDVGLADHMIIGYTLLSRIAFQRGDVDQSFHCLTELEYLGHHRQLPRVVSSAKLERSRLLLMQGNTQGARDELNRAGNPDVWKQVRGLRLPAHDLEDDAIAEVRWQVFAGAADVVPRLEGMIEVAAAAKRHRRALKLRTLLSMAHNRSGNQRAALAGMTEVLRTAGSEGYIRLIVDEGERAGRLVREASGAESGDPIYSVYLQKLLQAFGPALGMDGQNLPGGVSAALLEPLTIKEIRILALLAEGYSNSALAEKLFVSDSTVRTHLRHINGKLNAQNRTQAVAVGRKLGVIQ